MADYLIRWLSRTEEMDLDIHWTTTVDIDEEIDSRITLNETFKRRESLILNSMQSPPGKNDDSNRNRLRKKFEKYANSMTEELIQAINGIGIDRSQKTSKFSNLKTISPDILLMVFYCLQPTIRLKISVFNYSKDEKLAETILRSICKCKIDHSFLVLPSIFMKFSCGTKNRKGEIDE